MHYYPLPEYDNLDFMIWRLRMEAQGLSFRFSINYQTKIDILNSCLARHDKKQAEHLLNDWQIETY